MQHAIRQPLSPTDNAPGNDDDDHTTRPTSPPRYTALATGQQTIQGRDSDAEDSVLQFDIVPRSDASSFQAGYQGLQQRGFDVWLRGDVLIKQQQQQVHCDQAGVSATSNFNSQPRFSQCTIDLLATESIETNAADRHVVHQLHHSSLTLWTSPSLPGTSHNDGIIREHQTRSSMTSFLRPPGVLPFQFSLPEHLPHCIHLPRVKIEYRLVATLHPMQDDPDQQPLTRSVLVHLTRYTPPSPVRELIPTALVSRFSDEPKEWTLASPTTMHIWLGKTLYRRAEPIKIRIRIPPPDEAVVDKNLRIRSVEAELIRIVKPRRRRQHHTISSFTGHSTANSKGKQTSAGSSAFTQAVDESGPSLSNSRYREPVQPLLHRNATADGWEPHTHLLYSEGRAAAAASDPGGTGDEQPPSVPTPSSSSHSLTASNDTATNPAHSSEPLQDALQPASTVLSYSGKACRFSMQRALVLRLMLVPPFTVPTLPHPSPDHDAPPSGLSPLSAGTSATGGGCESVSQETELSSVQFRVRITIHLRGQSPMPSSHSAEASSQIAERHRVDALQDVKVEQEVYVLPGLAGDWTTAATSDNTSEQPAAANTAMANGDDDEEEEFDGYEDFRDEQDAYGELSSQVPTLSVHSPPPSLASTETAQGLPTFEESSRHVTTSATLNMAATAGIDPSYLVPAESEARRGASFATVRRQEDGEEPPPNVEDSRNDLQIFLGQDGPHHDGEEDLPPPPPISPGHELHEEHLFPPPWDTAATVNIAGVGTGERRLRSLDGEAWHAQWPPPRLEVHDQTPPPDFEIDNPDGRMARQQQLILASSALPDSTLASDSLRYAESSPSTPPPVLTPTPEDELRTRPFGSQWPFSATANGPTDPPPYIHSGMSWTSEPGHEARATPGSQQRGASSSSSSSFQSEGYRSAAAEKEALAAGFAAEVRQTEENGVGPSTLPPDHGVSDLSRTPAAMARGAAVAPSPSVNPQAGQSGSPSVTLGLPSSAVQTQRHVHGLPPAYYSSAVPLSLEDDRSHQSVTSSLLPSPLDSDASVPPSPYRPSSGVQERPGDGELYAARHSVHASRQDLDDAAAITRSPTAESAVTLGRAESARGQRVGGRGARGVSGGGSTMDDDELPMYQE